MADFTHHSLFTIPDWRIKIYRNSLFTTHHFYDEFILIDPTEIQHS